VIDISAAVNAAGLMQYAILGAVCLATLLPTYFLNVYFAYRNEKLVRRCYPDIYRPRRTLLAHSLMLGFGDKWTR
jgi:hypothetical protein